MLFHPVGKEMSKSKYGKCSFSDPKFEKLAFYLEGVGKVTGRTSSHIYLDDALVKGCNSHVSIIGINEVPNPNPSLEYHSHPADEIPLYIGTNPDDLKDLGGDVEMLVGDERESHVFDTTTVVFIPKNVNHVPVYKRVDRPMLMVAILFSGKYQ